MIRNLKFAGVIVLTCVAMFVIWNAGMALVFLATGALFAALAGVAWLFRFHSPWDTAMGIFFGLAVLTYLAAFMAFSPKGSSKYAG